MRPLFSLDPRLMLCARFVRPGAKLADIGTDHAYLPVWLVLNGVVRTAIAADINPEPLSRGSATIDRYGLSAAVSARLSDGLLGVLPDEADDIVIAGMGGDTIAGIIENAPWLRNDNKQLILQPMTKSERLISFLYDNGFEIVKRLTARDADKLYTVMSVRFCGDSSGCDELFTYCGGLDPQNNDDDREYLSQKIGYLKNKSAADPHFGELAAAIENMIEKDNQKHDNN